MSIERKSTESDSDNDQLLKIAHSIEYWVILVLVFTIGLITLLAMMRLFFGLYHSVFVSWDIQNSLSIQMLFGMVMTVLIALEFGNSILRHIRENSTIIQAQEVILIGEMAIVRKIMIIDMSTTSAWHLGALGIVAISLAGAYWFMRDAKAHE